MNTFEPLMLWAGINTLLMLGLALNVTRHRFQAANEGYDQSRLERAIRAHGNNIEYVPVILLGMALLAASGMSAVWIHACGATLFIARSLHAYGIQQTGTLPKTRVLGNLGTWLTMLIVAVCLTYQGITHLI